MTRMHRLHFRHVYTDRSDALQTLLEASLMDQHNTHDFPLEKWMGVVATADRQSTNYGAQAEARLTHFDISGEADYKAMRRGWLDSKYVTNHPAPKQAASDNVKHEYALELARCQFAFIVAYSLPSQTDLHIPSRTAQKRRLVTFMYCRRGPDWPTQRDRAELRLRTQQENGSRQQRDRQRLDLCRI